MSSWAHQETTSQCPVVEQVAQNLQTVVTGFVRARFSLAILRATSLEVRGKSVTCVRLVLDDGAELPLSADLKTEIDKYYLLLFLFLSILL